MWWASIYLLVGTGVVSLEGLLQCFDRRRDYDLVPRAKWIVQR